jgi:hypothetical protein
VIRQPVNSGRPFGSAPWLGVSTKRLNEQVKRNRPRFPDDLMSQLTAAYATIGNGTAKRAAQQLSYGRWTGKLQLQRTPNHPVLLLPPGLSRSVQGLIVYAPSIFG